MPNFRYKAVAAKGDILQGVIDAPSRSVAIEKLQSAGHLPISADEVGVYSKFKLTNLNTIN